MIKSHTAASRGRAGGLTLALCVALLAAPGCKKETPAPETKAEAEAAPTADAKDKQSRRNRNADEGVEVPTEEDFEDAVEKQITASSDLKQELDLIEKQIEGK